MSGKTYVGIPLELREEMTLRLLTSPMTASELGKKSRYGEVIESWLTEWHREGYVKDVGGTGASRLYKMTEKGLQYADRLHKTVFPEGVPVTII